MCTVRPGGRGLSPGDKVVNATVLGDGGVAMWLGDWIKPVYFCGFCSFCGAWDLCALGSADPCFFSCLPAFVFLVALRVNGKNRNADLCSFFCMFFSFGGWKCCFPTLALAGLIVQCPGGGGER